MKGKNLPFWPFILTALLCLGVIAGCAGRGEGPQDSESPNSTLPALEQEKEADETEQAEPQETPRPSPEGPLTASDRETVKRELTEAMEELRQPRIMDISAAGLETPEMDVKNIYYEILAERPGMKYAYDLSVTVQETELTCRISYMPYKTGTFPEDFSGEEVSSIQELVTVAESHLGEAAAGLRIMDGGQEPDRMNRALQQVGGGYILCMLNADATALQYSAPPGMTMEECMAALELADELADEAIAQVITPGMTQKEQARALYSYLTENVAYDQRFYSDRANMPYEAQTAVGVLRDRLAICGGYANALKLLYEKVGIPCYTVSGKYFQENHMWNVAQLDGQWLWFDATTDRGNSGEYGFLRFALTELDGTKYQYKEEDVQLLTGP